MQFICGYSVSGKVIAVKDGDTIEILKENKPYRQRNLLQTCVSNIPLERATNPVNRVNRKKGNYHDE